LPASNESDAAAETAVAGGRVDAAEAATKLQFAGRDIS